MKTVASLFFVLLLFGGCSLFDLNASSDGQPIDMVLTLEEGESKTLIPLDAHVRFVGRVQDSRCPQPASGSNETVNCVWEGEVEVQLAVTIEDQTPSTFALKGYIPPEGDGTVAKDTLGLSFVLLRVTPYPVEPADHVANSETPTITLRVEHK